MGGAEREGLRCEAEKRGLDASGHKRQNGAIMPARNGPRLNAAPGAWCEFAGDNGDLKFALRIPILPETHEGSPADAKRCLAQKSSLDLAYEVQLGQSMTAGYFGGYTAKMQDVGRKELIRLREGLLRHAETARFPSESKAVRHYAQRLIRGLEGQGTIRTSLETINLALNIDSPE